MHVRVGRDRGRSGRRSRPARRCAARPRRAAHCATIASTSARPRLRPASIRIRLLPRAAAARPLRRPAHQMRPSQCAAAILSTRVSGAISTDSRKTIAPRPFQRPQIGPDQGQRKEGRARFSRQIRHMLPARDKACADLVAQAGKQAGDTGVRPRRQAAPTASRRRPPGATAAAAAGPATASCGRPQQQPRQTVGLAAGGRSRVDGRRRPGARMRPARANRAPSLFHR